MKGADDDTAVRDSRPDVEIRYEDDKMICRRPLRALETLNVVDAGWGQDQGNRNSIGVILSPAELVGLILSRKSLKSGAWRKATCGNEVVIGASKPEALCDIALWLLFSPWC